MSKRGRPRKVPFFPFPRDGDESRYLRFVQALEEIEKAERIEIEKAKRTETEEERNAAIGRSVAALRRETGRTIREDANWALTCLSTAEREEKAWRQAEASDNCEMMAYQSMNTKTFGPNFMDCFTPEEQRQALGVAEGEDVFARPFVQGLGVFPEELPTLRRIPISVSLDAEPSVRNEEIDALLQKWREMRAAAGYKSTTRKHNKPRSDKRNPSITDRIRSLLRLLDDRSEEYGRAFRPSTQGQLENCPAPDTTTWSAEYEAILDLLIFLEQQLKKEHPIAWDAIKVALKDYVTD